MEKTSSRRLSRPRTTGSDCCTMGIRSGRGCLPSPTTSVSIFSDDGGSPPNPCTNSVQRRPRVKSRSIRRRRRRQPDEQLAELLRRYVDLFNARDVEGLKSLIAQDARLVVVGIFEGDGNEITERYFTNYGRLPGERKLALGSVDGELVVLGMSNKSGRYVPALRTRLEGR